MSDNVTPEDWEAQLIDYTLGVMEPGEAAAFEADLAECRRNVQMAREYSVVSGWMGLATPPSEPPAGHKNRLMTLVQSTPQAEAPTFVATKTAAPLSVVPTGAGQQTATTPPANVTDISDYRSRRSNTGLLQALLGAAAVVIFLLGLWAWTANSDKLDAEARVNIPAGYSLITLPSQKGFENVTAVAFYNPQKNDVVMVGKGLAPLPSDKVYELWFLKGQGNPDPAGTFLPDQAGNAQHTGIAPQTVSQYAGFAVSEEPAPGGTVPTGPIIAAGTFTAP